MPFLDHELYHTDLFRAILENKVRGHPILKTLLFLYCPMAVKLWLKGIDPVVPYDPVWDAMTEYASGTTLRRVFESRGFPETKEVVLKYIGDVLAYQRIHPREFPDPRQVLPGIAKNRSPFRYQNEGNRFFGGDFRNIEIFIRTWRFIIERWELDAGIPLPPPRKFLAEKLAINIPGIDSKPIAWPAWGWAINDKASLIVGLLANEGDQDRLLFSLADYGIPNADKARNPTSRNYLPNLLILNRNGRRTLAFQAVFDAEKLMKLIPEISKTIQETVCLPLAAINNRRQCVHCGFHHCCYSNDGDIRPEVLSQQSAE
jgi:hypothetical protein